MINSLKINELRRSNKMDAKVSHKTQRFINWFAFFLAFPAVDVLGQSITFYFFLAILLQTGIFWKKPYPGKFLFVGFIVIGTLSSLLTPIEEVFQNLNFVKTLIQFYYWIAVASFFIVYFHRIDLKQLSKWVLYGLVTYTIAFYLIRINFDVSFLTVTCTPGRNAYVFVVLCCAPMSFIYLKDMPRSYKLIYAIFLFSTMLVSNGRAGVIVIAIELLTIIMIVSPVLKILTRALVAVLLILVVFFQIASIDGYLTQVATRIESVNPRFASLLTGEGEGDLDKDKSWLIRKLMIDKGKEIFNEYPILGIGPLNFKKYRAELKSFVNYKRLHYLGRKTFELNTSPHNTYLQALSEFGLLGSIFFLLLIVRPLFRFVRPFIFNHLNYSHLYLVGLMGMCIHFYSIASLTGALPWFIIGLAWASAFTNKPIAA